MPRVEYALSFENYLEMMESSRKKPSYKPAAISALVGFSCIIGGYIRLQISPGSQPVTGVGLLAFGLFATFLALPLAFVAKAKDSEGSTATTRREYELFASDQRAIEFDETGFRVSWFDGEDVRPWSSLRGIHDQRTLLVLSTQTTYYWLPKAALERAGQAKSIQALAERALNGRDLLFSIPLHPSPFVYVMAMYRHYWPRHYKTTLLGYTMGILLLYWIFLSGSEAANSHSPWILFVAPLLFFFCEGLYYLRKYFLVNWSEVAEEADIMSDCIRYKTPKVLMITTYPKLMKMTEVPGAFMLYFQRINFHIIPKKGFSRDRIEQFRKLVSSDREHS